jgi:GNAT superfamily N-acetyltransferase
LLTFGAIVESDLERIKALQPEGWSDIVSEIRFYIRAQFCYPIKAICDNEIVGVGAAISYRNTGWLAHIIVSAEHRNKGIGGAIVNHLCDYLKSAGHKTILLTATEMGYPVYKKAGFIEQTEYVFFETTERFSCTLSDSIVRITKKDKEEVLDLDKLISGEDRQHLLSDYLNDGYIYRRDSQAVGYYLPGLGEGLIIADDPDAGIELIKFRNSFSNKGVLPLSNAAGIEFYRNKGFNEIKRIKRMIYGEEIIWRPEKIFSRIGGNFG